MGSPRRVGPNAHSERHRYHTRLRFVLAAARAAWTGDFGAPEHPRDWSWIPARLAEQGLCSSRVDGDPGPKTEAAVAGLRFRQAVALMLPRSRHALVRNERQQAGHRKNDPLNRLTRSFDWLGNAEREPLEQRVQARCIVVGIILCNRIPGGRARPCCAGWWAPPRRIPLSAHVIRRIKRRNLAHHRLRSARSRSSRGARGGGRKGSVVGKASPVSDKSPRTRNNTTRRDLIRERRGVHRLRRDTEHQRELR
jgi:hypothetical protein